MPEQELSYLRVAATRASTGPRAVDGDIRDVIAVDPPGGQWPGTGIRDCLAQAGVAVNRVGEWSAVAPALRDMDRQGRPPAAVLVPGSCADPVAWLEVLLELVHSVMALRRDRAVDVIVVHDAASGPAQALPWAEAAMGRVVTLEDPLVRLRSMVVAGPVTADLAQRLCAELRGHDDWVRVSTQGREVLQVVPAPAVGHEPVPQWPAMSTEEIVLVTGGTGDVGRVLARSIGAESGCTLALVGRSPQDAPGPARVLADLRAAGVAVRYERCDVTDRVAVADMTARLRADGVLRGVVHAAGAVDDAFVRMKTAASARAVAAPKVLGATCIDEMTRDDPLAFFLLCSSLAGTLANVGQADYAFANGFLDGFAVRREAQRLRGERHGATCSVVLPAVRGTAMVDSLPETASTAVSLSTEQAVSACQHAVSAGVPVLVPVSEGAQSVMTALARGGESAAPDARIAGDRVEEIVLQVVREVTGLDAEEVTPVTSFRRMGVESILALSLTAALEKHFGQLPKTLFFEHDNPRELAARLAAQHQAAPDTGPGASEPSERPSGGPAGVAVPPPPTSPLPGKWDLLAARARAGAGASASGPAGSAESSGSLRRDIAIIGIAGRYPQAPDLDSFWHNLREGVDAVTEVPGSRWDHERIFDPEGRRPGSTVSRWGGFLDGIECFDPLFFGISPAEAAYIDPQERLFLQTAWHALEEAGYAPDQLDGREIGVFAGAMFSHYQLLADAAGVRGGGSFSSIVNRVSWTLGLRGPSVAVDTMCSSSLTALHLACRSLATGECEAAIVGGVNIMPHPAKYVTLSQAGFLSTDGRCRSFGAGGDGYVPAEGVGAVVLKPLRRALADGDHVHAVLRGSALNAAGRTNGYTVPSPVAEGDVIGAALSAAGVDPATVSCVEAHGTGTALGDPIELVGLTHALGDASDHPQVWLGSVKSSIGHAESAAGVAALTKVVLQLRHRTVVPSLHSAPPNPNLDLASAGFRVPQRAATWAPLRADEPLRAVVSAFGAGGANANIVVEEAPAQPDPHAGDDGPQLVVLSAPDAERLDAVVDSWRRWLRPRPVGSGAPLTAALEEVLALPAGSVDEDDCLEDLGLDAVTWGRVLERVGLDVMSPGARRVSEIQALDAPAGPAAAPLPTLAQIAATSQLGRVAHPHRVAVLASSTQELSEALEALVRGREHDALLTAPSSQPAGLTDVLGTQFTQGFVADAVRQRRWADAARMWVLGVPVDWAPAWQGRRPRRVSLPLYPFREDVCWLTPTGAGRPLAPATAAGEPAPELPDHAPHRTGSVEDFVLSTFSRVLGIPRDRLDVGSPLEAYGTDSIRIRQLLSALETRLPKLPASLMFQARTVGDVVDAIVTRCADSRDADDLAEAVPVPVVSQASPADHAGTGEDDDIAIVGVAGRFPGAPDTGALAARLRAGEDLVSEAPPHRWDWRRYEELRLRWGGFIDEERCFDAEFFGIAPATAAYMDPQERILLECVWQCVADAGYVPPSHAATGQRVLTTRTGVYAGVSFKDYALLGAQELARGRLVPVDSQHYSAANRVSYHLDLQGPSIAVDTACSSSLTALHTACADLRAGRADAAVAGGVNLLLHPAKMATLSMLGFVAQDGRCHSFGDGGSGYVPSDGVGAVLLKRLSDARADGDHVYAVVRGSAVNHGGRVHGYTVPSPAAQTALVREALASARVDARTVTRLEAHGTGTDLGDPIEVEALTAAYEGAEQGSVVISSVKANMGHAEAAAGIAQVIKVVLEMSRGECFPHRTNSATVNPRLALERTPFRLPTKGEPWQRKVVDGAEVPLRAGISSFGAGGANAHLVLEEAPARVQLAEGREPELVVVSGTDGDSLGRQVRALLTALDGGDAGQPSLAAVATTLRLARPALSHRLALVASTVGEVRSALRSYLDGDEGPVVLGTAEPDADAEPARVTARPGPGQLLDAGRAWTRGRLLWGEGWRTGSVVPLPGYSFARTEHWLYNDAPVLPAQEGAGEGESEAAAAAEDSTVEPSLAVVLSGATPAEREAAVEAEVRRLVAATLGYKDPGALEASRGFFDMGMDSISSTDLSNAIEERVGRALDMQMVFTYPTIEKLTGYLLEELEQDYGQDHEALAAPPAAPDYPVTLLAPTWIPVPSEDGDEKAPDVLLLLADTPDLYDALVALPPGARPRRIVLVRPGASRQRVGADSFCVRTSSRPDLDWLLEQVGETISHVLVWWSRDDEALSEQLDAGYYTVMALCQALRASTEEPTRVLVGYGRADDGFAPSAAAGIGGFARAVRIEVPGLDVRTLEVAAPSLPCAKVAESALRVLSADSAAVESRLAPDLERRGFTGLPGVSAPLPFRERGVYLVTGGRGGLGSLFARELASRYGATVVLAGRRRPDEESDKVVAEIRAAGGSAEYISMDLGDGGAVRERVDDILARHGSLNGVIHAAGLVRDGAMLGKSPEDAAAVLAPKVAGTAALEEAVAGLDLDVFVAFSSVAGVLGNYGQSDYCFANASLDQSMVRREALCPGRSVSISWSFWGGVGGMPATEAVRKQMRRHMGVEPLEAEDAWRCLTWALASGRPHVIVTKGDLERLSTVFDTEAVAAGEMDGFGAGQDAVAFSTSPLPDDLDNLDEEALAELLRAEIEMSTMELGNHGN